MTVERDTRSSVVARRMCAVLARRAALTYYCRSAFHMLRRTYAYQWLVKEKFDGAWKEMICARRTPSAACVAPAWSGPLAEDRRTKECVGAPPSRHRHNAHRPRAHTIITRSGSGSAAPAAIYLSHTVSEWIWDEYQAKLITDVMTMARSRTRGRTSPQ